MTVLEPLDIREKEVVMLFRTWCRDHDVHVFSADTFKKSGLAKRLVDTKDRRNVGGLFKKMLDARNPLHRIKWVAWEIGGYNRRQGQYMWTTPPK